MTLSSNTNSPPPSHYLALPLLEIDGRKLAQTPDEPEDPLMRDLMEDLIQLSAEESLHLPGMFTIVVKNDYYPGRDRDQPWRYRDLLAIGKTVKIGFQSSTTERADFDEAYQGYVLEGEITSIETHFTGQSQAPIIVRGYDLSHRLHRGRYNRSFQNITDSDIVKKIAKELRINFSNQTIENSGSPHDYVFQENQTNMEFLQERAARIGFEIFIKDNQLYFRKPAQVDSELELKWLTDVHSFRVRVNSSEQVSNVEVRAWDYSKKQPIVVTKSSEQVLTETEYGKGHDTSTKFKTNPTMIVVDQPVFSPKEAEKIAQSLYDELGGEFVLADAKAEGDPRIRIGRVIQLQDMGPYTGKYYVTETRHLYHERFYTTEFSIRGLRGGNLVELLSPKRFLQPGQTLLVGIVTNNKDPENMGRVKVKFPTLTEDHESNWARVVGTGAANNRGFDCLPEINDEVLVAFEHGDIHRPYVIGGVWNGRDKPPERVGDSVGNGVRLRTFKTRIGHKLQFVDEDKGGSKKGVMIVTAGGHKLYLNDSDRCIEVETSGGHKMKLDDGSQSITLDSTGSIKLSAKTTIDINANSTITINGSMVFIN